MNDEQYIAGKPEKPKGGYDDDDEFPTEMFKVITSSISQVHHKIYLSESIDRHFHYVDLIDKLMSAGPNDKVTLYLASYGGYCNTGFQIINAIKECKPGVDIVTIGECYSMGAIMALSGKSLKMLPGTFLMFHNFSGNRAGKGKESLDAAVHYYNHFHEQMARVCGPFLTRTELDDLKHDKDVYINSTDRGLHKRIKRHF